MNEAAYYFTFSLGSSSRVYEILEGAMRTRCYPVSCLRWLGDGRERDPAADGVADLVNAASCLVHASWLESGPGRERVTD